jgi:hypothetical protein
VLDFDDLRDADTAESVLAVGNNRTLEIIDADWAFFLALDGQLKGLLKKAPVLVVEYDGTLLLKELEKILDSLSAECPVIANLAKTQQSLQDTLESALLTRLGLLLEFLQGTLCLIHEGIVLSLFVGPKSDAMDILRLWW